MADASKTWNRFKEALDSGELSEAEAADAEEMLDIAADEANAAFDAALEAETAIAEGEAAIETAEAGGELVAEGAGIIAVAIASMAVGQGLAHLIGCWWDPVNPMHPLARTTFTSVTDLEIDNFLRYSQFRLGISRVTSSINRRYPELGTLLANHLRLGVRAFVDGAQGAAAATANEKAALTSAADALQSDLHAYGKATADLCDAFDYYKRLGRRLPRFTLAEAQAFVDLAKIRRLPVLIDYEGIMIQQLFNLARVRTTIDVRENLYEWIAQGLGPSELKAYQNARYNTLSTPQLLRVCGRCFDAMKVSESPLLV